MKKTTKNKMLTPEQYIRQKAQTLPLGQCYMNKNWFISGIAIGVVTRCHNKGTYTVGIFQMDTFCSGINECKVEFSLEKTNYNNLIKYLTDTFKIEPVTYTEVHNLIYGAMEFGQEAGFTLPMAFSLAQHVLEEDTEDIPLIKYQYGKDGKHFLWAENERELDTFMPHLINHLGKENVLFGIIGSPRIFRGEDFYDSATRALMRSIVEEMNKEEDYPIETYSYVHPEYPSELKVKHTELADELYNQENCLYLPKEKIEKILALPHDEVKEDLEQILLYETGKTCGEITEDQYKNKNTTLLHCLILLGELGYKESLPVVLETLSQQKEYYDYHLGVLLNEIYVPTLYKLGKDQLDKFYEFLQIPGLYTFARYLVFPAVVQVALHEEDRREEVIEWFRKVLQFYADKLDNKNCCDGSLIGLLTIDLFKIQAVELLPELKVLFSTGKVDTKCSGNFEQVEKKMKGSTPFSIDYNFDIYQRYGELEQRYERIAAEQAALAEQAESNQPDTEGNVTEAEEVVAEEVVEATPEATEVPVEEKEAATEEKVEAKAAPAKAKATKAKTSKAKKEVAAEEKKETVKKATKAKKTVKKETGEAAAPAEKKPRAKRTTKKTKASEATEE